MPPLISPNAILDPLAAAAQGPRPVTQAPTPAPVRQPDPRQGPLGFVAPPAYANAPDAIKRQAAFVEYLNAYDRAKRQADAERAMIQQSRSVDSALRSIATAQKFIAQRQLAADLEAGMPLAQALPKNVNAWFGDKTIGPSAMRFLSDEGGANLDFRTKEPRVITDPSTGKRVALAVPTGKGSDQLIPDYDAASPTSRLNAFGSHVKGLQDSILNMRLIDPRRNGDEEEKRAYEAELKTLQKDLEMAMKVQKGLLYPGQEVSGLNSSGGGVSYFNPKTRQAERR